MNIRWRIFTLIFLLFGAGLYFFVSIITEDLQPRYREATEDPIVDTSRALAALVAASSRRGELNITPLRRLFEQLHDRPFEAQIYGFTKTEVDIRVYVTNVNGIVVFDSDGSEERGKDYSQWRDVYLTLRGEYGARTSPSSTDPETKILYVASPIVWNGEVIGVLSVGKSAANSNRFVNTANHDLTVGAFVVFVILMIVALILGQWLTRPIQELTRYAQAVRDGQRPNLPSLPGGELNDLGHAFEEMRRALEGKQYVENYVQTLTHEIKSPLSAIRGAAELLAEDLNVEQRERFITNIQLESARITRIVETLMLLTALEARGEREKSVPISLRVIVRQAIESMAPAAGNRQISFDLRDGPDAIVDGDEVLIRQAVINVLQNALDFSPDAGTITVEINQPVGKVALLVTDQGTGIPAYAVSRIFDRFYSLARPDTGKKSSGLGLSLVKEIMALHGGEVTLNPNEGGGTVAQLSFTQA